MPRSNEVGLREERGPEANRTRSGSFEPPLAKDLKKPTTGVSGVPCAEMVERPFFSPLTLVLSREEGCAYTGHRPPQTG